MYHICWAGVFIMNKTIERNRTKKLAAVLIVCIGSALLLLCVASLLVMKLRLRQERLGLFSSGIVFFSVLLGGVVLLKGTEPKRRLRSILIFWAVAASSLLMLGFLAYGDTLSSSGLIRILIASFAGASLGAVLTGRGKKSAGKSRRT